MVVGKYASIYRTVQEKYRNIATERFLFQTISIAFANRLPKDGFVQIQKPNEDWVKWFRARAMDKDVIKTNQTGLYHLYSSEEHKDYVAFTVISKNKKGKYKLGPIFVFERERKSPDQILLEKLQAQLKPTT